MHAPVTSDTRHRLLVDLYELTMVDAYRREGMDQRPATFSLFVRDLPAGRGFLVAAGLDDALAWLEELHFADGDLAALAGLAAFDPGFLDWLAGLRFTGDVRAVPEGTVVFAHQPILEVDAPIGEAQLAETFLLNQVTLQTTLATKAARCRHAAAGRAVVDFALRRTQGVDAGMKLARCGALVGLSATSNVAGAARYGLPASGTMGHAFVQAHADETDAFRAFARAYGEAAVLLVDTYDSHRGIERAITVARELKADGTEIRGIRLDSGDLAELSAHARRRLDEAGLPYVQILASGGLDEHAVHRLVEQGAPIDGFGLGSALGVSADAPTLDSVYKLVAFDGRPVMKTSAAKAIWPGAKQLWRAPDWSSDVLALAGEAAPGPGFEPQLVEVMHQGRRTPAGRRSVVDARHHFEQQWAELPDPLRRLQDPPARKLQVSVALARTAEELRTRHHVEEAP